MARFGFRPLVLALALLCGGTAALACSCMAPGAPEQSRQMARQVMGGAVAIVEAEIVSGYDQRRQAGERVRTRRVLWGRAPATFTLERRATPSSASCDLLFEAGERRVLILSPAEAPRRGGARFRPHGLCTDFLTRPEYRAVLLQEARRARR